MAELLIEIGEGNATIKRRLRMELAGAESPAALVNEIRKRLATISRARAFLEWQHIKPLVNDLQAQRKAIVEQVAKRAPADALDLMWRFLDLAQSVFARCDDSNGVVAAVFQQAVQDLGTIAQSAGADPKQLADRVFAALTQDDYGQSNELIAVLQPALGRVGLEHLKQRVIVLSAQPISKPEGKDRRAVGWGSRGPIYADELAERARVNTVRFALQEIADALGDVDAYIAQYDANARKSPAVAAEIAQRLVAAGRAEDAWQAIEAADSPRQGWFDHQWGDARIAVLDALGRGDDAQAARWESFTQSLSAPHLRDYLKRLPDFDDFEAEQRALDHAELSKSLLHAVHFLVTWPALDRAAKIVVQRCKELDGNHYEVCGPAAEALAARYPLAATLLLRAMIDFTLTQARSSRYGHAARHLRECGALAAAIGDYGTVETHDAYVARLRREHGRKTAFWAAAA